MISTVRICPYCGSEFRLEEALIIATDGDGYARGAQNHTADEDLTTDEFWAEKEDSAEATAAARRAHSPQRRTLWDPQLQASRPKRSILSTLIEANPPLKSLDDYNPETMARRACPKCHSPLPLDIDTRQLHLLAIAGLNSVGKTHFLAAAMTEATRKQSLRRLGWREFEPDVETAPELHQKYFVPLFRQGQILKGTQVDSRIRFRPLTFRATLDGKAPLLIMTHDIAGEALADHRLRARDAPFLRRASAVIFLVDPTEFDSIYQYLPDYEKRSMVHRSIDQVDLLAACIRELQFTPGGEDVPIAVTVSKADILSTVLGRSFSFSSESRQGDDWISEIRTMSEEVEAMLLDLGEWNLVETAKAHGRVTFHAVSPLGCSPNAGDFLGARPVRCIEPLAAVLVRLAHALN